MTILIKNAKIIFPKSDFHNKVKDILIKNGVIEKIGSRISDPKAKTITSENLHVSIGWCDIGTQCSEPGFEHRESLTNLSQAAAAGGYTTLAIMPNTSPPIDNKSSIHFILNATKDHLVEYLPIGGVSKGLKGEEITEMLDMFSNGSVAFSDGLYSIDSSGLMLRALEYSKTINGIVINQPNDKSISNGNCIHEGISSTNLGLKASPNLSEILMLERDIELLRYSQSRLLAHQISTKEAVQIIGRSKIDGLFTSVAYLNLCLTEKAIEGFEVNAKVSPPLRSEEDRTALIEGITKGKIEIITSNHVPLEEELKKKEFTYAASGVIGLQTCYSAINTYAPKISVSKLINTLAINPRKMLNINLPEIKEGAEANITLFDPDQSWTFDNKSNLSKSNNSPFWNKPLTGKILGTINGKKSHFNNY